MFVCPDLEVKKRKSRDAFLVSENRNISPISFQFRDKFRMFMDNAVYGQSRLEFNIEFCSFVTSNFNSALNLLD